MKADADIVRAVLRGDREAFAALVTRYERAVWATTWRVLRDHHAASDAGQEAFLQAFHRLGDLRLPERFGVWVLRIARHEAIRLARRKSQKRNGSLDEPDAIAFTCHDASTNQMTDDAEGLLTAVARLPEHERVVVVLHYLEGHSVTEIAAMLERPVGTVTKQLSRAIGRLRIKTKGVLE